MRFWANGTTRDHDPVAALCLLRNLWDGAAARILDELFNDVVVDLRLSSA
jgi:hypothetical protein